MNNFTDFKHNVSTLDAGQKTFQQCWYACYQSMYKYYKKPPESVDSIISNAGIDLADAKANGLIDKKYHDAGTAMGMTMWSGEKFKQDPSWYDVGLTDGCEAFITELQKGPLWVSRYIAKDTYHIVIATGFKWGASENGYIIYNNPFPGPRHAVEVDNLLANVFVRHITSARGSVQAYRQA